MRASQWVNSFAACRTTQNTCEWGQGPGQAALLPQRRQAEAVTPVIRMLSRTPQPTGSSLKATEDRRLWGSATYLEFTELLQSLLQNRLFLTGLWEA